MEIHTKACPGPLPLSPWRRRGLYALLALVAAAGMGLSLAMNSASEQVRSTASPLLRRAVPMLDDLAGFETALLKHQLALHKRFAGAVDGDRFLQLEQETRTELAAALVRMARWPWPDNRLATMQSNFDASLALTPGFAAAMRQQPPDMARGSELLSALNHATNAIRSEVEQSKREVEQVIYASSSATESRIGDISQLVHLFALLAAVAAGFLFHHVRARLRAEAALSHLASHDPLTGLPHRRKLEATLQALGGVRHTLVLGVIERFERIVVGLGHGVGDRVMSAFAQRLHLQARRLGGEVFRLDGSSVAVLFREPQEGRDLDATIESLRESLQRALLLDGQEISLSLRLASVRYPEDSRDANALLHMADAALLARRDQGLGSVARYTHDLSEKALERLRMEAQLRHAIERGELELFYQPQRSLADGSLVGFEALLRWHHPQGLVSPAQFIPLAEETGLIVPIGAWVLEQACRQAVRWNALPGKALQVAVNVSARQFQHAGFLASVQATLAGTGADPALLELEITESVAMQDPEKVLELLHGLKALGVSLSIDDFGTGHSSLSYLRRYPLDKLKIDQSFVRGMPGMQGLQDPAIVETVIHLARHLHLVVIAEGVETAAQHENLRALGCDQGQGYLYARPLPVAQASALIALEHQARAGPLPCAATAA